MKKKLILTGLLGVLLAAGLFVACDINGCPRGDNCSGAYWCQKSSCNAKTGIKHADGSVTYPDKCNC